MHRGGYHGNHEASFNHWDSVTCESHDVAGMICQHFLYSLWICWSLSEEIIAPIFEILICNDILFRFLWQRRVFLTSAALGPVSTITWLSTNCHTQWQSLKLIFLWWVTFLQSHKTHNILRLVLNLAFCDCRLLWLPLSFAPSTFLNWQMGMGLKLRLELY